MRYEELKQVNDGALIVIKGIDYKGDKIRKICVFNSVKLSRHGYFTGICLYPCEWIEKATHDDYLRARKEANDDYNRRLKAIEKAYQLTNKGERFIERHTNMEREALHNALRKNGRSRNIHFEIVL